MLGLDEYGSSEEDVAPNQKEESTKNFGVPARARESSDDVHNALSHQHEETRASELKVEKAEAQADLPVEAKGHYTDLNAQRDSELTAEQDQELIQRSPCMSLRDKVHNLTLPPIPNLSIPDSPEGSPRANVTAKFDHFLNLKAQGAHFNQKLSSSTAFNNPATLKNLMDFAGIDESVGQYANTLPMGGGGLPGEGWPIWAYVEELNKSQSRLKIKKDAQRRGAPRDFVAALHK